MQFWKVHTLKKEGDIPESYVQTSIDFVLDNFDEALREVQRRFENDKTLEVVISKLSKEECEKYEKYGKHRK